MLGRIHFLLFSDIIILPVSYSSQIGNLTCSECLSPRVLPALICCLIIRFPTEIYNNRAGYIVSDFKPLIDWETACYASGIKGRLGKYPSQICDPIHRVAPYSTIAFNNPFRFSGLQPANNSHPNYPNQDKIRLLTILIQKNGREFANFYFSFTSINTECPKVYQIKVIGKMHQIERTFILIEVLPNLFLLKIFCNI